MVFCFYCYYFTPFYPKTQWANITNNGAECVDFAQGKLIHTILAATAAANCRDLKDNPTFAYASQRSASGFLSPPRICGLTVYKRAAASLFPRAAHRCRVKKAKAWFCLFRVSMRIGDAPCGAAPSSSFLRLPLKRPG